MLGSRCTRDEYFFVSLVGCLGLVFLLVLCLDACLMSRSPEAKPSKNAASMNRAKSTTQQQQAKEGSKAEEKWGTGRSILFGQLTRTASHTVSQLLETEEDRQVKAATKIQAIFRGVAAREKLKALTRRRCSLQ